jgi:hypothetical protein
MFGYNNMIDRMIETTPEVAAYIEECQERILSVMDDEPMTMSQICYLGRLRDHSEVFTAYVAFEYLVDRRNLLVEAGFCGGSHVYSL